MISCSTSIKRVFSCCKTCVVGTAESFSCCPAVIVDMMGQVGGGQKVRRNPFTSGVRLYRILGKAG